MRTTTGTAPAGAAGQGGAAGQDRGAGREDAGGHPGGDATAEAVRARLSAVLRLRWLRTGSAADLAAAIELARGALATTPRRDPRRCGRLLGLGTCLTAGYAHSADPAVLTEAVEVFREAEALSPRGGVEQAWARSNLAEALLTRAEQGGPGAADALDEAVALIRAASAAVPADLPLHQRFLSNLSRGLLRRYLAQRDPGDLAAAATAGRAAVAGTAADHPDRPERLGTLVTIARLEYERLRSGPVLDELIEVCERTARETPAGHPVRVRALTSYAWALGVRAAARRDPHDLSAAEDGYRHVAEDAAAAVADRVRAAQQWAYHAYRIGGAERAMAPSALAVELLPRLAPRPPSGGGERAPGSAERDRPGGPREPDGARAAALTTAPGAAGDGEDGRHGPYVRDAGAGRGAALRARPDRPVSAASGADAQAGAGDRSGADGGTGDGAGGRGAASGRPAVRGPGAEGARGPFAGPASYAAACAIELGDPWRALRLLEHGRTVLLAHAVGAGPDAAALQRLHPGLVERYHRLREALDPPPADLLAAEPAGVPGPSGRIVGAPGGTSPGEDRHALAEEWEQLVDRIRRHPGFEGFLHPPEDSELLAAAHGHGPVVVLNTSWLRCDALLLTDEGVRAVPLPELRYAELLRRTERFLSAVRAAHDPAVAAAGRHSAQGEVHELLEWLWETVADPVLKALRLTGRQRRDRRLPRLWWVPTGPLTVLPLHAAQRRTPSGTVTDAVLDRVVSSYAPSVGALVRARARAGSATGTGTGTGPAGGRSSGGGGPAGGGPAGGGGGTGADRAGADGRPARRAVPRPDGPAAPVLPEALVVAPVAGAGAAELADARYRTALLTAELPGSLLLAGDRARRDVVLDMLPRHRWAHFACPAVSSLDDAASSRLVLSDRPATWLGPRDITRPGPLEAELAYLPGCTTSWAGGTPADEAVHLGGVLQLAGYAHVIGALWAVEEPAAGRIAAAFYRSLAAGSPPTARHAAYALHQAVRAAREADPALPTLWAAHLHMGP
ncbi:CHAT domain-containing protein [Streptomyces pactum]|uniref:CHAT domain-containing protein n=1 Tax=Streptomyces pactum TaxID=68249 RepID=A0ABS0NPZ1_9ACTN|nr:CHAT domain-containing protein [Streptomyces pactum]MBH5337267.1 CHAT domain-containing protein [Streptomyces pactum]